MSTKAAAASKPRTPKAEPEQLPPSMGPAPIAETVVQLIRYPLLDRAPENVRQTRASEDIDELADDIAAHGLLQSLIGYQDPGQKIFPQGFTWIVGGGRRLAALALLHTRGIIDDDYRVPVVVRPMEEAVELSLSENLARRDMSPVDEFIAFERLMRPGTTDAAGLAKRFGFTERYVKQRLRLAQLAPEILEALAERKIGMDAALAYVACSDVTLQAQVFREQEKSTWDKHAPARIRAAYSTAQLHTGSALFKFVGADTYEADGGEYEDDLFGAADAPYGGGRKLASGPILLAAAERMAKFQGVRLITARREEYPSIEEFLVPSGIRIDGYPWKAPKPPKGYVLVSSDYAVKPEQMWANAKASDVSIFAIVGVNGQGELAVKEDGFFVPKADVEKVKPARPAHQGYQPETPEQRAARQRAYDVEKYALRLALGSFADTPYEGRVFWPQYGPQGEAFMHPERGGGWAVNVRIWVSDADVAAKRIEAEQKVDELKADELRRQKEAEQAKERALDAKRTEIAAMDPQPAVLVADGETWFRWEDGSYADRPESDGQYLDSFDELTQLLAGVETFGEVFPTIADYEALAGEVEA